MAVVLEVRSAQGNVTLLRINPGRNRITVRPGDTYRLIDDQTQYAPAGMSVKRADNHVVIDGFDRSAELAANPTVIELSDFYGTCSAATPCQVVIEAAGQVPVTVTPVSSTIGALADGSYVLYDPSYVTPQGTPGVEGSSGLSRPMLYGLGGLAIAGLALAGGGGGGGGGGSAVGSDPGPTDGTLRVTSSSSVNNRKPVITGTGEPGSTVQLQMDLNRDGLADVRYDARVGADGRWSIDLASAAPASGSLPAGGISDSTRVLVSANGPAGARSLPLFTLAFDDVAPLPARVDPITLDSVISAPEKQAGIAITGSGEAGGTVSITWGAVQKVVAVGEDGRWSARFATNEIPNDGQSRVEVVSRDAAGNAALPTAADVRVSTGGPVLSITQIGSGNDTTINAAEAANGVQVRGNADPNSQVSVGWNNQTLSALADASGNWAVVFSAAQTPNPSNAEGVNVPLAVRAVNPVGNASDTQINVLVDRVAPSAPAIAVIEGDDRVSQVERGDGVRVGGTTEAGARVAVEWAGVTRTVDADGSGRWAATFSAAEVPAVGAGGASIAATARATDTAGNVGAPAARAVFVEQPFAAPVINPVEGNDLVNAAERADGVVISGTVEAGAPGVNVGWGAFSQTVTPSGTNWSVTVPANLVPADGTQAVQATIAIADGARASREVRIDTTPPAAPAIAAIEGDDRVSQAERGDGVRISGTTEAGARIAVEWAGVTRTVDADGSGQWAATFSAAEVPAVGAGGASFAATARATDTAGNVGAPAARAVFVEQPFAAPVINPVEGNDLVNAAERADGVVISGTVEAGAPGVNVGWGAFSQTVTPSGTNWSVTVPANLVPADGTQAVQATIAIADGARASREVRIDATPPAAPAIAAIEGDNRVTVAEAADGATIAGTAEGGATVLVNWQGIERNVTADGGGRWSADFSVPEVAAGGAATSVTAVAVDTAGNRGPAATSTVFVERPFAAPAINPITGDWVVNLAEASGGVVVSGTHAAGVAGIEVRIGAVATAAALGAGNSWRRRSPPDSGRRSATATPRSSSPTPAPVAAPRPSTRSPSIACRRRYPRRYRPTTWCSPPSATCSSPAQRPAQRASRCRPMSAPRSRSLSPPTAAGRRPMRRWDPLPGFTCSRCGPSMRPAMPPSARFSI